MFLFFQPIHNFPLMHLLAYYFSHYFLINLHLKKLLYYCPFLVVPAVPHSDDFLPFACCIGHCSLEQSSGVFFSNTWAIHRASSFSQAIFLLLFSLLLCLLQGSNHCYIIRSCLRCGAVILNHKGWSSSLSKFGWSPVIDRSCPISYLI